MNRFSSFVETIGSDRDPDILFYTASIVNNETADVLNEEDLPVADPYIRFNETREKSLLDNVSDYQFSIVRFTMDGANLNLPLFCPQIQQFTGQTDPNLTVYGIAMTYSGTESGTNAVIGKTGYQSPKETIYTYTTYIEYVPEIQNPTLAPRPQNGTANKNFVGDWASGTAYAFPQIVYYAPQYYQKNALVPVDLTQPPTTSVDASGELVFNYVSPNTFQPVSLTSRYYWIQTYTHWLVAVQTAFERANRGLWDAYVLAGGVYFTSYNTATDATAWITKNPTPIIEFDPTTNLFNISFPPSYLSYNDQVAQNSLEPNTGCCLQLYFNTNMAGLFSNFKSTVENKASPFFPPGTTKTSRWAYPNNGSGGVATQFTNATLFPRGFYSLLQPVVNDNGSNIITPAYIGTLDPTPPAKWVKLTQDYQSTGDLWSPIDAIVFTTSLIPVLNEQNAPPNVLGGGNLGNSQVVSQSAFQPVITDVSLDLTANPSGYRKMIRYEPVAEFRMSDFQRSLKEIRNIDIQVWWRGRLDNVLYPVSMYNLSSVSIKLMFRKRNALSLSKGGR